MTSAPPNASSSGGKSLNASSHSPLQQQHQSQSQSQSHSNNFESSSKRSGSHCSLLGASPRNNQGQRKSHKNSRKPRVFVDDDDMAESVAMRNANSRRGQTSITHLMNFSLPPRPHDYRNTMVRGTRRGNIYGIGSGHHSSDKARYIHANYRFIVKPCGDYKQQTVNADQHLDWNDVLQILASSVSQEASCPICLSHPVAPRMAKCGHIFCLPCLIRFMHSTDDANSIPEKKARWKNCPICWDLVYISETRPVRWYTGQESPPPREGDDVVLRLVMRLPSSTLALPRDGADAMGKSEDLPWYFAAEVTDYARIMKGGEDYMLQQYDNEIEALRQQENEDELMFGEEPEWTRKAVQAVKDAKEKLTGIGNPPPLPNQPTEKPLRRQPIIFKAVDEESPEPFYAQNTSPPDVSLANGAPAAMDLTSGGSSDQQALGAKSNHPQFRRPGQDVNGAHNPDAPYFFYQSLLHYYLAPLDIRILKAAFGNFAAFPSTLLPRVERVSTGHIMDDELRKRTKYLSHLPYGCEVGFMECNWTDVVAPEVLDRFKEDIERRRKRNRDKEYREEKDRLRAEKAEDDARWANARRKRPSISTESFSSEDYLALAASSLDASNASPPWPSRQGSAFATLASPSTSPSGPKTVWGTAMVNPLSPEIHPQKPHPENGDGWLDSWEQELTAENELIAQVQATSLGGHGTESAGPDHGSAPVPGRKKKGKKITLMSTTARRAA